MKTYACKIPIPNSRPAKAVKNNRGNKLTNNNTGPATTIFHVKVEIIFNKECPAIILAPNRTPKETARAK